MTPGEPVGANDPWLDLLPPDAGDWSPPRATPGRLVPSLAEAGAIPEVPDPFPPGPAPEEGAPEPRADRRPGRLVRPYMVSGGRTSSSNADLELEALVATTSLGESRTRSLSGERRRIALLCRDVLSVAEVSAHIDVPLGVAFVVVGDMADEGLVQLHRPASPDARPDLALLERVLYGLRDL
jgi:hypothetical protein